MATRRDEAAEKQRKQILDLYAAGGMSMAAIADKMGITPARVRHALRYNKEIVDKAREGNNRVAVDAPTMCAYLDSKRGRAQALIDALLEFSVEDIAAASMRDRMGAIKILSETFADRANNNADKEALDRLCDAIINAGSGYNG